MWDFWVHIDGQKPKHHGIRTFPQVHLQRIFTLCTPNRLCWKLKIMNIFQISDLGISKNPSIVSFQVEPHKVSLHVSIFLRQVHLYTSPKLNSGYFKFVDSMRVYFLPTKSWFWSGEIVKMYFIRMYHDAPFIIHVWVACRKISNHHDFWDLMGIGLVIGWY